MENKEVLDKIANSLGLINNSIGQSPKIEILEYIHVLIKCVKRQTPKEPIKERSEYLCPVCEEYVGTDMIGGDGKRYIKNYCEECGQRIQW